MGGCYSAFACSKKALRGLPAILPITDHDDAVYFPKHAAAAGENNNKKSSSKNCRKNVLVGIAKTSASEFARRYVLGEELGRGEFGVTRRCTDVATGERLACKTIKKRRLRQAADVEDVRREVEIMRHMAAHGGAVVQLLEACEDADSVHLVMELCQGGELFDRIVARGHYTERAAAKVARTIVEVVQLCHKNGVIHRDLKPENFLFANKSEDAPLKVIDFGLSVFFKPGDRFTEVVGSAYYMAPEVLKKSYGPEVDVWSAGVILYILLCGVPPFWGERDDRIAQSILRGAINFLREPWPKVSQNAKDLVRRMLDPNPATRLTAKQVLEHPWLKNADMAPNVSLGEAVRSRLKQFSAMNKFKKKALGVVANNLPLEEVEKYKQMFHMMDKDKDGSLTLEDLKGGLRINGQPVPETEIKMLLEAADIDGNGKLECDEFVTVSLHLRKMSHEEHLAKAFKFFDKDGSGFIEMEELIEALGEGELGPTEQVIKEIINDVDKDKDGRISYQEFELMMKAGSDRRNASRQYSRVNFSNLSHMRCKKIV